MRVPAPPQPLLPLCPHTYTHKPPEGEKGVSASARKLVFLGSFSGKYTVLLLYSSQPVLLLPPPFHFSSLGPFCSPLHTPVCDLLPFLSTHPFLLNLTFLSRFLFSGFFPWLPTLELPKCWAPLSSPPPAPISWVFSSSTGDSSSPRNNGPHLRAPL